MTKSHSQRTDKSDALVKDVLENQGRYSWPEYALRNGFPNRKAARAAWERYTKIEGIDSRLKPPADLPPPKTTSEATDGETSHQKQEGANFITTDTHAAYLYNESDVAAFFKIDTEIWEVDRTTTNYWEQGAKLTIGNKVVIAKTPLYQLKLTWKRKDKTVETVKSILLEQTHFPDFSKVTKIETDGKDLSVDVMITDLHLGKIGFDPDTMEMNWTLPQASEQYNLAIDHFLENINLARVAEFTLPVGNDLLNIDNSNNTTKRGTPQMAAEFWQNLFRFSKNMVIASIEKLCKIAPVYVYMIPGNHDEDSIFTLGEVIAAYFKDHPNVSVNNTPNQRKYHEFGANMVGYSHGHEFKMNKAMQVMATEQPLMFARTKFRAFKIGHFHANKIDRVVSISTKDEHFGVEVEVCPSMSATDEWHNKNAYIGNVRRSKCFVRHRTNGLILEIYYNVPNTV